MKYLIALATALTLSTSAHALYFVGSVTSDGVKKQMPDINLPGESCRGFIDEVKNNTKSISNFKFYNERRTKGYKFERETGQMKTSRFGRVKATYVMVCYDD